MKTRHLGWLLLVMLATVPVSIVAKRLELALKGPTKAQLAANLDRGGSPGQPRGANDHLPRLRVSFLAMAKGNTEAAILSTCDLLLDRRGDQDLAVVFRSDHPWDQTRSSGGRWALPPEFGGLNFAYVGSARVFGRAHDLVLVDLGELSGRASNFGPNWKSGWSGGVPLGAVALRPGVPAARLVGAFGQAVFLMVIDPPPDGEDPGPLTRADWLEAFRQSAASDDRPDRAAITDAVQALEPEVEGKRLTTGNFGSFAPVLDAATAGFVLFDPKLLDRCAARLSVDHGLVRETLAIGVPDSPLNSPWANFRADERAWVAGLCTLLGIVPHADVGTRTGLQALGFEPGRRALELRRMDELLLGSNAVTIPRVLAYSRDPHLIDAARLAGVDFLRDRSWTTILAQAAIRGEVTGRSPEGQAAWNELRRVARAPGPFPWSQLSKRAEFLYAWAALPFLIGLMATRTRGAGGVAPLLGRGDLLVIAILGVVSINGGPLRFVLIPAWLVFGRAWLVSPASRPWWGRLFVALLLGVAILDLLALFGWYITSGWVEVARTAVFPLGWLLIGAILLEDPRWPRRRSLEVSLVALSVGVILTAIDSSMALPVSIVGIVAIAVLLLVGPHPLRPPPSAPALSPS